MRAVGKKTYMATMVFSVLLVLLVAGSVTVMPVSAYNPDSWNLKLDNDNVRNVVGVYHRFVSCNGKYYAVMGGSSARLGCIAYYDPNTDKWAIANNSTIQVFVNAAAVCNNRIYIYSGGTLKAYDTASQSMQQKAPSPTTINSAEMYTMGDKIYVFGSDATWPHPAVTWIYDPAVDSWSQSPSLMPSYSYHAGTVIDNKLYVVGTNGQATSLMIFDPKIGIWTQGAPVPYTVTGMSSCATEGVKAQKRLYVVGSYSQSTQLLQVYDPQTKAWSNGTSPPSNVTVSSMTSVDDQIYAFCESNFPVAGILNYEQIYVYMPQDYGVWTPAPSPFPSPTGQPTQSPSPSPSPSQTEQPTLEPTQTATPTTEDNETLDLTPILALTGVVVIAVAVGALVYFKKRIRS